MFEAAPAGRGTFVTVLQEFRMGSWRVHGRPYAGAIPNRRLSKTSATSNSCPRPGKIPRTQGQPHGPRGAIGSMKESAYAEKIAKPPGLERKAS